MNYLLYGGARNTGKSQSIYRITNFLIDIKNYTLIDGVFPSKFLDFTCVLEKGDNKILIQSGTDTVKLIIELKRQRDINKGITHIITANRNKSDYMRGRFSQILDIKPTDYVFEIPLGKVVRGNTRNINLNWYLEGILNISKKIIKIPKFNF